MAKEKCTKDVIRIAVKLKKHGALDKDIALACGVCPQTFSTWLHHPQTANQTEFSEAVKKCEADFKDKLTQIIMRDAQEKVFPAYAGMIPVTFWLPKGESWENVRPVHTHNGTFGGTFSVGGNGSGDIYHLTKANTLGYDAICNEGRYTIDRTEKSRPEEFYEAAKAAEIGAKKKAIDTVGDEWLKSGKSIMNGNTWEELEEDERKAASDIMDKWFKENADKFGYTYRFMRRKGN